MQSATILTFRGNDDEERVEKVACPEGETGEKTARTSVARRRETKAGGAKTQFESGEGAEIRIPHQTSAPSQAPSPVEAPGPPQT
jgi:hypothetical protein